MICSYSLILDRLLFIFSTGCRYSIRGCSPARQPGLFALAEVQVALARPRSRVSSSFRHGCHVAWFCDLHVPHVQVFM